MSEEGPCRTIEVQFSDYNTEIAVDRIQVDYGELHKVAEEEQPSKIRLLQLRFGATKMWSILQPYLTARLLAQVKAVLPLSVYLVLFQMLLLRKDVENSLTVGLGLGAVMIGLMLFMDGLRVGLMPLGQIIGETLPSKVPLAAMMAVIFLLGIGVTFAEPAIGALQTAGALVRVEDAPYLYLLLNERATELVLVVGVGVGLAAVVGALRFIKGWSLKPLIFILMVPTLALTAIASMDGHLTRIIGLAWDCGAVTTGPVTVPLVLALGIGIASSVGKGESSLSGFGIVTMASLFPIVGVLLLGFYVSTQVTPEEIIAASAQAVSTSAVAEVAWHEMTPAAQIIAGMRAIVPLVLFLFFVQWVILRSRLPDLSAIAFGILLTVTGMIIFNIGLTYGLVELGEQAGTSVPGAFSEVDGNSPIYSLGLGLGIVFVFAWLLGFGATLAEPALNALGLTVENLTNGVFRKMSLLYAVSFGVGTGIAIGMAKIIFQLPIVWLLFPAYAIALVLTVFSREEYVNVAWDSAGVTTGPVTVPLVLAMGLGVGNVSEALEGFAILAMASVGPIISVLATGLWLRAKERLREYSQAQEKQGFSAS